MNAGCRIREGLLLKKMQRWMLVARNPSVDGRLAATKARKNYWALVRRHRDLAATNTVPPRPQCFDADRREYETHLLLLQLRESRNDLYR